MFLIWFFVKFFWWIFIALMLVTMLGLALCKALGVGPYAKIKD